MQVRDKTKLGGRVGKEYIRNAHDDKKNIDTQGHDYIFVISKLDVALRSEVTGG